LPRIIEKYQGARGSLWLLGALLALKLLMSVNLAILALLLGFTFSLTRRSSNGPA
jgi:hypothetical protein